MLCVSYCLSVAAATPLTAPVAPRQWQAAINSTITGRQFGKTAGYYYSDEDLRAFRVDKPGYAPVVTLYREPVPKGAGRGVTMAVVNGVCKIWCPAGSVYRNLIKAGDGKNGTSIAKDCGAAVVRGKSVEAWKWSDTFGPVPMDSKTLYTAQGAANFTPIELVIDEPISRFHEKSDFQSFLPGLTDPSTFKVSGIDSCPMSPKCAPLGAPSSFSAHFRQPSVELAMPIED